MTFKLHSKFQPAGDQPKAIKKITEYLQKGVRDIVLLGVTGSGKTFTMASVIAKIKKPTLVISPNKTLSAQLYQEFKDFFPQAGVHYFVSYYDYYQPEAYIPQTDTYIEKDAKINEEINRLRHLAVQDLLTRRDVIIVASVSCIYNLGSPENYQKISLEIKRGKSLSRRDFLKHLVSLQYERNDIDFSPGKFRVRGDTIDIFFPTGKKILRVEFKGNKIGNIFFRENIFSGKWNFLSEEKIKIFPARFWVPPEEKINIALENIKLELEERLRELRKQKKFLEAERLEKRTNYDLEMIRETGYCHGIENYSRHLEFRPPGSPPFTLLDYFPSDFLVFIDESHQTLPQIHAMANQDRARKETLIKYGFRLPSSLDNRPLTFKEFHQKIKQTIYVSATPGSEEKKLAKKHIVEQIVRPTGLLEPEIEIRSTENQIKDVIEEIKKIKERKERVLLITLTKRLAEEISDFLSQHQIKSQWIHSEVKTLERPTILSKLRKGQYDVLIGINLLREGIDLPEVSLVAILDADKEGFLRSETTLIQLMGRASRHLRGRVILYADQITSSMKKAIREVRRRRKIQEDYNKKHHITPKQITKEIKEWPFNQKEKALETEFLFVKDIKFLRKEMKKAAQELNFERAAKIRDLIREIEKESTIEKKK